jgi:hypothetical protein
MEQENNLNFFNYLKTCYSSKQYIFRTPPFIKNRLYLKNDPVYYYIFRQRICEYVYEGINQFPDITHFTISCENETGTTCINIKETSYIADDDLRCLMTIDDMDTGEMITLNRHDIKNLYTFNRQLDNDGLYDIDIFMTMLIRGGKIPEITVMY